MGLLHSSKGTVSARAQVSTEHDTGGAWGRYSVNPGDHGAPVHATMQMWVEPGDGHLPDARTVTLSNGWTLFESHLSAWGASIERLGAGRWTYVRYDPDHPDRCEIDQERLTKEFDRLYNGKQRLLIPKETSDAWFPSAAPLTDAPATPDSAATAVLAPTGDGLVADLARLGEMRAAGTLSEAEFAEAKAQRLAQGEAQ